MLIKQVKAIKKYWSKEIIVLYAWCHTRHIGFCSSSLFSARSSSEMRTFTVHPEHYGVISVVLLHCSFLSGHLSREMLPCRSVYCVHNIQVWYERCLSGIDLTESSDDYAGKLHNLHTASTSSEQVVLFCEIFGSYHVFVLIVVKLMLKCQSKCNIKKTENVSW